MIVVVKTDNGPVEVDRPRPRRVTSVPQFAFEWFGADDRAWNLCAGPVHILSGARGFGMPTPQHWFRQSLGDGASHNGLRIPPREVFMPVEVESSDWLMDDRDFFAGLDPRKQGRFRVTTPKGTWREIACRYAEGADDGLEVDPHLTGRQAYPLRFTAEDPYWYGEPVSAEFKYAVDMPWLPEAPAPASPDYYVSEGQMLGYSSIINPGDVSSRAVWRVHGPFTGFSIGIGDATLDMTLRRNAGQYVEVDMGVAATVKADDGTDLSDFVDDWHFPAIPPGEVEVTTTLVSPAPGSEVSVSFVPRFYRAW